MDVLFNDDNVCMLTSEATNEDLVIHKLENL